MKNISFCDRVCQNIISPDLKQSLLDDISTRFGANIIRRHHARMDAAALARVSKAPHIVCLRSNGNPYFMYLTQHHHKNVCIFIDKKIQGGYALPRMVLSPFQLAPCLFLNGGTLFDGEMVKDNDEHWLFLINDAWGYCGASLAEASLAERLKVIDNVLRTQFMPSMHDICAMQMKQYVKVTDVKTLVDDLAPSLQYNSRGLLFKPLYRKFTDVLFNFDDSLVIKAQRPVQNKQEVIAAVPQDVVVMRIMRGSDPDVYKFVDQSGTMRVKTLEDSLNLRACFYNQPVTKQMTVSCKKTLLAERQVFTFLNFV